MTTKATIRKLMFHGPFGRKVIVTEQLDAFNPEPDVWCLIGIDHLAEGGLCTEIGIFETSYGDHNAWRNAIPKLTPKPVSDVEQIAPVETAEDYTPASPNDEPLF